MIEEKLAMDPNSINEPINFLITALTLGLSAGLQPTAEQVIKDAYNGFKSIIQTKFDINLNNLEKKPKSESQLEAVKEALMESKADEDLELIDKARELIEAVKSKSPSNGVGVDFSELNTSYLHIRKLNADKVGLKVDKANIKEGITIDEINVGNNDPKEQR
jgi:uncharacterized protein YktA (UPF0223 family)